jgi:hypothetical protein
MGGSMKLWHGSLALSQEGARGLHQLGAAAPPELFLYKSSQYIPK